MSEEPSQLSADVPEQSIDALLQAAIRTIEGKLNETRGDASSLLADENAFQRMSFNKGLLESIAANVPTWEKEKPFNLRISQLRALHKLIEFLERGGNEWNTGYFRQPTGAGKTVLYSLFALLLNRKTVIFVPKNNLLTQTKEEMIGLGIPESDIGMVGDGHCELGRQFLIVNYASHNSKMSSDAAYTKEMNACDVMICDEAHTSLGLKTREKRAVVGVAEQAEEERSEEGDAIGMTEQDEEQEEQFFQRREKDFETKKKHMLTLGFTATTELRNKSVHDYFHELIAEEKYAELVEAGILVPFRVTKISASSVYEDELRYISEKREAEILEREGVYRKLALELKKAKATSAEPLFPVAFCATQAACDKLKEDFLKEGLRVAIVTSRETLQDDDALKNAECDLLSGAVDCIATVDVLTAGWNLPPVNCALLARASQSPARIVQGIGRTSRAFEGSEYKGRQLHIPYVKTHALIIEPVWVRKMRDVNAQDALDETDGDGEGREKRPERDYVVTSGATPLDFAQAMAMSGEDPGAFISRTDGQPLQYTIDADIDELYQGRKIVTAIAFFKLKKVPLSDHGRFFKLMNTLGVDRIPHLKKRTLGVFFLEDLERVFEQLYVQIPVEPEQLPQEELPPPPKKGLAPGTPRADKDGYIMLDLGEGPRKAMISSLAMKLIGDVAGKDIGQSARVTLKRYGIEPVNIPSMVTLDGKKTHAFWEDDVLRVAQLVKAEVEAEREAAAKVVPIVNGITAREFATKHDLPEKELERVAKIFELQKQKSKEGNLFSEEDLHKFSTLIRKNDESIALPDIRSMEKAMRGATTLSGFGAMVGQPMAMVATHIRKKNVAPLEVKACLSPEAIVTLAASASKSKAYNNILRVEDAIQGTFYVYADRDQNSILQSFPDMRMRLYWIDELQEAMKDFVG